MHNNQANNQQNQNIQIPEYPIQYPAQQPQYQYQQPYLDQNIVQDCNYYQQQNNQQYQVVNQPYNIDPNNIPYLINPTAEGMAFPVQIKCQFCQQVGITRIQNRIGEGTICASILVLLLCWPLFWLPCCLEDCQDRIHLCQSCGKVVGSKKYELC